MTLVFWPHFFFSINGILNSSKNITRELKRRSIIFRFISQHLKNILFKDNAVETSLSETFTPEKYGVPKFCVVNVCGDIYVM
jgi:hypothetical protein